MDAEVVAIESTGDMELSAFDLKEVGFLHDVATEVDLLWRTVTRKKYTKRAKTQQKEIIGILENLSEVAQSDNTSTSSQL